MNGYSGGVEGKFIWDRWGKIGCRRWISNGEKMDPKVHPMLLRAIRSHDDLSWSLLTRFFSSAIRLSRPRIWLHTVLRWELWETFYRCQRFEGEGGLQRGVACCFRDQAIIFCGCESQEIGRFSKQSLGYPSIVGCPAEKEPVEQSAGAIHTMVASRCNLLLW